MDYCLWQFKRKLGFFFRFFFFFFLPKPCYWVGEMELDVIHCVAFNEDFLLHTLHDDILRLPISQVSFK